MFFVQQSFWHCPLWDHNDRNSVQTHGHVRANLNVNETRHPEVAPGNLLISLDLQFAGAPQGFRSPTNRWELTGQVTGTVSVAGKPYDFDSEGKWHEQTGLRAQFAPAFTYFNVQGNELALLAIAFADRVNGYVLISSKSCT